MKLLKPSVCFLILFILLVGSICSASPKKIGKTDIGNLYILTETVKEDKSGEYSLTFAISEEEYTNPYFLDRLHQDPRFRDVVYCWKVYVFNENRNEYCIDSIIYVDSQKKPVLEKESKQPFRPLSADKEAQTVHKATKSLLNNK